RAAARPLFPSTTLCRSDDFLATLAHELRNPLAPIRTGLELLRLGADDPQMLAHVRAMMERQMKHLVRLVDDLLDVSRITAGKFKDRKSTRLNSSHVKIP